MNNDDWIIHYKKLGLKETESAKYNGFVYEKSTQVYRQHVRKIIESFRPGSIMDLCCGSGDVTGPLTKKFKVFGIDAIARSCALATQNGLTAECCNLKDYKSSRKYGLILCCEAIYWLDEPQQLFDFFHNFSDDDGCLVIAFLHMDSIIRKLFNFLFKRASTSQHLVDKYNFDLINELAKRNSLKLVQTDYILQYAFGAIAFSAIRNGNLSRLLATNLILSFRNDV